ncbi:MAG: hypothetical protein IKH61_14130 [Bacteroidales bacterium]|nr:hypothetical protein [Bacteroidales bacterium]
MDTESIVIIIAGIASIAMAIFGKFRPDIVYKGMAYKIGNRELTIPEKQRWGFVVFLLFGIMLLLLAVVLSIPQWQVYQKEILFSIIMVMTVVMLLLFWKMVLSQNERYRISLVIVLLFSVSLLAVAAYFWYVALS